MPSRVFAAFASEEAKNSWGDTGDLEPLDEQHAGPTEFDFRVGPGAFQPQVAGHALPLRCPLLSPGESR